MASVVTTFRPFVYGLEDPKDPNHIRYVGMAPSRVSRPYDHARNARNCLTNSRLLNWIRKLHAEGRNYSVRILEQLPEGTGRKFLGFVESCYIQSLSEIGHELTNSTDGGDGGDTGRLSTPEERAAMSAFQTGRIRSAATRARMSEARKRQAPTTSEAREKISRALTGRKIPDIALLKRLATQAEKRKAAGDMVGYLLLRRLLRERGE